jgi:hypothetical protein
MGSRGEAALLQRQGQNLYGQGNWDGAISAFTEVQPHLAFWNGALGLRLLPGTYNDRLTRCLRHSTVLM